MIETTVKAFNSRLFVSPKSGLCFPDAKHATGVLGSGALSGWGAKVERNHVIDTACAVFGDIVKKGFPPNVSFRDQLEKAADKLATGAARQESMDIREQVEAHILWQMRTLSKMDAGLEPKIEGPASLGAMAFADWAKENRFILYRENEVLYDEDIGYRCDLQAIGMIKGRLVAIEVVVGSKIYDDKLIRFAAAVKAAKIENPDVNEGIMIRVPKTLEDIGPNGAFEAKRLDGDELNQYFTCFTHLLHYWESIQGFSRMTIDQIKDGRVAEKIEAKKAAMG